MKNKYLAPAHDVTALQKAPSPVTWRDPHSPADISPDIQRPNRRPRRGNTHKAVCCVVAPDSDITVCTFGFNRVIPAVAQPIPLDIRISVRKSSNAEIGAGSEGVIVLMAIIREHSVVPNYVITFTVPEIDRLRSFRMIGLPLARPRSMLLPVARITPGMMNAILLHNYPL